jgi:hypothetical protein
VCSVLFDNGSSFANQQICTANAECTLPPAVDEPNHIPVIVTMVRLPVNNRRTKIDRARTLIGCRAQTNQPARKHTDLFPTFHLINATSIAKNIAFAELKIDIDTFGIDKLANSGKQILPQIADSRCYHR